MWFFKSFSSVGSYHGVQPFRNDWSSVTESHVQSHLLKTPMFCELQPPSWLQHGFLQGLHGFLQGSLLHHGSPRVAEAELCHTVLWHHQDLLLLLLHWPWCLQDFTLTFSPSPLSDAVVQPFLPLLKYVITEARPGLALVSSWPTLESSGTPVQHEDTFWCLVTEADLSQPTSEGKGTWGSC